MNIRKMRHQLQRDHRRYLQEHAHAFLTAPGPHGNVTIYQTGYLTAAEVAEQFAKMRDWVTLQR